MDSLGTQTATISVYDAGGQRVKKVIPGATTVYIGQLYECTGGICTKYIFGGSDRIVSIEGTNTRYYHTDHLGSSSVITDQNGASVQAIHYYPYGEIQSNIGIDVTRYKFTGQEWDAETDLYYYGARYYDPKLARFISADTIVPMPFYPQSLNRYAYCYNNPIVLRDLDGHSGEWYDGGDLDWLFNSDSGSNNSSDNFWNWGSGGGSSSGGSGYSGSYYNYNNRPYSVSYSQRSYSSNSTSSSTSSVGIGGGGGASVTSVIGGGGTMYAANAYGNGTATDAGSGGSPENQTVDLQKMTEWMDAHAKPDYTGRCALHFRLGLEAGGADTSGRPEMAGAYGPFLEKKLGWLKVDLSTAYEPQMGDAAVFTPVDKTGHVQAWDGGQWVSDTIQTRFLPNRTWKDVPYTIYRQP